MDRSSVLAAFIIPMILAGSGASFAVDVPVLPYVEVVVATEGPVSLFSAPDGSGHPLTEAFGPGGQTVDGTITMTLYDDYPPWGQPVAFFPKEDLWLEDIAGDLVPCRAGAIPDRDTDANGTTIWTGAIFAGGHLDPAAGNKLAIMVNGSIPDGALISDFGINSADLNGDLTVNLTDVQLFVLDYFHGYRFASDLFRDGAANLSDVALLAASMGAQCP